MRTGRCEMHWDRCSRLICCGLFWYVLGCLALSNMHGSQLFVKMSEGEVQFFRGIGFRYGWPLKYATRSPAILGGVSQWGFADVHELSNFNAYFLLTAL